MLDVKPYQERHLGFSDLLNWSALIDDGTILTKDGSLLGGWFYRGEDMGVSSPAQRNYQTQLVNDALSRLGEGWSIWFESARIPSPDYPTRDRSYFSDPISFAIDEERRHEFTHTHTKLTTLQALIIQYKAPKLQTSRLGEFFFHDPSKIEDLTHKHLKFFNHILEELEGALSAVLAMQRMHSYLIEDQMGTTHLRDDLINFLSFCLNGKTNPINIPPQGAYLDSYINAEEFYSGLTPKIGDQFIYCVALEGYPAYSHPGIMDMLEGLALTYRFSNRFVFVDPTQASQKIEALQKAWGQKARGFFSQIFKTKSPHLNEDALAMANEAHQSNTQAHGGLVSFGYYTPVIILMGTRHEEIRDNAKAVVSELKRFGIQARIETINATAAYFGSLPGHTLPNVRRPFFHTQILSDFLPLASLWTGHETNPCDFYPPNSPPLFLCATTGATPFCFNWHVGQLGHGLIFGPTRSGKSTFLAFCMAQFLRYPQSHITAFDKGYSLQILTKAIGSTNGAQHYDIARDEQSLLLAPLSHLETMQEQLWATNWISQCYTLHHHKPPSPDDMREINKAINQLAQAPKDCRSLTDFCAAIQSASVREVMNYYTIGHPGGYFLDGCQDSMSECRVNVFELQYLLKLDRRLFIPTMSYLISRFIASLKGQPAMLIIDEAWTFLKSDMMRQQLEEWLRVLAKANCIVILATQSLYDAIESELLPLLVESCATKVFLPNPEAAHPHTAKIYREFGLSEREIECISHARRQQHYYVSSYDGKRLIDLGLGPIARAFLASTSPQDLKQAEADMKRFGEKWPFIWAQRKGCLEDFRLFTGNMPS